MLTLVQVASTYKARSTGGGLTSIAMYLAIGILVWHEMREYLFGEPTYSFSVDHGVSHNLQINVDMTVAMPCHYITVDVRDAVGDRLHISDEFVKDGVLSRRFCLSSPLRCVQTSFEIGQAQRLQCAALNKSRLNGLNGRTGISRKRKPYRRREWFATREGHLRLRRQLTSCRTDQHVESTAQCLSRGSRAICTLCVLTSLIGIFCVYSRTDDPGTRLFEL